MRSSWGAEGLAAAMHCSLFPYSFLVHVRRTRSIVYSIIVLLGVHWPALVIKRREISAITWAFAWENTTLVEL